MCGLPSMSSGTFAKALRALGCEPCDRHASGSHQEWQRKVKGGKVVRRPIVIGKKDLSHKTVLHIIKAFEITKDDLRRAL